MQLPNDILLEFFLRLPCMAELAKCRRVCKRWQKVIESLGFTTVTIFSKNTIFPCHWPDHRKRLNLSECKWLLQACIKHVVSIDLSEVMLNHPTLQLNRSLGGEQMDDEMLDIFYQGSCLKQVGVHMNCLNQEMWTKLQALGALRQMTIMNSFLVEASNDGGETYNATILKKIFETDFIDNEEAVSSTTNIKYQVCAPLEGGADLAVFYQDSVEVKRRAAFPNYVAVLDKYNEKIVVIVILKFYSPADVTVFLANF